MKLSEVVVKILELEGITEAFGIPGAGINPVYGYLEGSNIRHHLMRHEEAAVHAADGYYRSSGKLALAICTSGPGATNFVTGLYTAWIDSIPLIAITGQGKTAQIEKGAFQCVDIVAISTPVVKKALCVKDATEIVEIMRNAIWTAKEGRPGPVLIDLPLDIQMIDIEVDLAKYVPKKVIATLADTGKCVDAIKLLDGAKNPLIIMGGGVLRAQASEDLIEFAEYMQIPIITTYMAKGGIPEDHPLNAGQVGIQVGASSSGNSIFLESDVILGIGCRFTDRHTGALSVYVGERKFIHMDVDPKEIGKLIKPEIGIVCDAKEGIRTLLIEARKTEPRKGVARVSGITIRKNAAERVGKFFGDIIDPRDIFLVVNEVFDNETMFTTGCGLTQIWSGQYQKIDKPYKYHPSGGAGTLGFDIPAAIGASIGVHKGKTVCMMGDFGFTFMVEELAVACKYELPVVVIIVNNAYLSLIRQNQKYAYKYEYQVAMKENKGYVDYIKIAEGLGCSAERVFSYEELRPALQRAVDAKTPYVVEIFVEDKTDCNMGDSIDAIVKFD